MKHRLNYIRHRKPIHAFTLIELLVVISIIALLISILMPSLQKARGQAKKVVCQSGLKQINLAMQLYLHDFDGRFPQDAPAFGYSGDDPGAGGPITQHTKCIPYRLLNYLPAERGQLQMLHSVDVVQLANKIFNCPEKVTGTTDWDLAESYGHGTYLYNMAGNYPSYDCSLRGKSMASVRHPSETGFARDFTAIDFVIPEHRSTLIRYAPAHSGGQNIAYLDTHIEFSKDKDYMCYKYYVGSSYVPGVSAPFPWPSFKKPDDWSPVPE